MSQIVFAEWVGGGLSATEVSNIELGKRLPDPPRMIAIAKKLGRYVGDLYVMAGYPEFAQKVTALDAEQFEDADALLRRLHEEGAAPALLRLAAVARELLPAGASEAEVVDTVRAFVGFMQERKSPDEGTIG